MNLCIQALHTQTAPPFTSGALTLINEWLPSDCDLRLRCYNIEVVLNSEVIVQWNLSIEDTLGPWKLSFI